jgi:ABC-type dipeptide/oligopeptide/nickel transport system permease component
MTKSKKLWLVTILMSVPVFWIGLLVFVLVEFRL